MLKVASRFEILVNQRKGMEEFKDMNTMEILQSIAGRYNQYKANAALKKWQLSPEFVNAIAGIIFGVCPLARQELQNHLNHNKWAESGALAKTLVPIFVFGVCFDCGELFKFFFSCFGSSFSTGYSETLLRLKRHQLNESPKGVDANWQKILTEPCRIF